MQSPTEIVYHLLKLINLDKPEVDLNKKPPMAKAAGVEGEYRLPTRDSKLL